MFNSFFLNTSTGWVAGDNGIIWTTNGCSNWITQLNEPWVYSVNFINENSGWAGVRLGKIFTTTNGGNNWVQQVSGSGATFYSMKFLNENTGWAVGDYNTIIKTTNGGINWFSQISGIPGSSQKFSCLNLINSINEKSWIAGLNGTILSSSNGGTNWIRNIVPIQVDYNSIQFPTSLIGYAVGANGTIIKTINDGITGIVKGSNPTKTKEFYLSQNFPNPFNPSTIITYSLPKNSEITLNVYDVEGRLIITLVDKKQSAGTYQIEFDGKKLPSGAYFYNLKSNDFIVTRKMLLVK